MKTSSRWLKIWCVVGILIIAGCSSTKTLDPTPMSPTQKPRAASTSTLIPATPTPITFTPTPLPPTATPTPTYPDASTNPRGALQYAEESALFRTATLTTTATFTMKLNESVTKALNDAASTDFAEQFELFLSRLGSTLLGFEGAGALEITDAKGGQANYYYRQEFQVPGQIMILEMMQIDKAIWMRIGGDVGRWEVYDISTAAPGSTPYNPMENLSAAAASVVWLRDETIDGENLHHLRVILDPKRTTLGISLLDTITTIVDATSEQRDLILGEMKIEADVWLISDSLRIRQESHHVEVSVPFPQFESLGVKDTQMRFSADIMQRFDNFDQPVDIKAPVVLPTPNPSSLTATPTTRPSTGNIDEEYSGYVRVQDSTGALAIEVPVEWDEVDGSPWVDDSGEILGASLIAAPIGAENGPLVQLIAGIIDPEQFSADAILDSTGFSDQCTRYDGRADYDDGVYTGRIDQYSQCGAQGGVLFVVAAAPEDRSFLTILVVLALNEADLHAADHIFSTFEVVGELPGTSVP